jgi:hypothetical protein
MNERVAQLIAHRVCFGEEHDPANGKIHGYCVVCGVPWPCEYAGKPSVAPQSALAELFGESTEWPLYGSVEAGSQDPLRCCPQCGAAVANAYQHKAWHLQVGG